MDILLISLIGTIAIAVLMHLHFKHAEDTRVALVSPPVFAVVGCLIGISVGMIWFSDGRGRVFIENGVRHAVIGAMVGGLAGAVARDTLAKLGRCKVIVVVLTLMLLAARVGAPIGWIMASDRPYEDAEAAVQLTRNGMLRGWLIGCLVGLAVGLLEACLGVRSSVGDAVTHQNQSARA